MACTRVVGFLCPLEANTYGIMFLSFSIRDGESRRVLFQVGEGADGDDSKEPELGSDDAEAVDDLTDASPDALRSIRYDFNVDVLRLPVISTQ